MKSYICLGEIKQKEVRTANKTFETPFIDEQYRSEELNLSEVDIQKIARFFYDRSILSWPTQYYILTEPEKAQSSFVVNGEKIAKG